jgi:hypothetical protein
VRRLIMAAVLAAASFAACAQDTAVQVLALNCTLTSVGPEIQGQIKNVSSRPLRFVVITSTFWDANNHFISVSHSIRTILNPVMPGQTSAFDGFGGQNPLIAKVTVEPSIMDGPALVSSGISGAPCQ